MKAFAEVLAAQSFEVQQPGQNTFRDVRRLTSKGRCDLLLVDLNAPLTSGAAMLEQLQRRGDVPLVFVGDSKCFERHAKELEPLLAQRDVDWVTTSAGHSEFGWRVSKMAAQSMPALTTWNIPELRSDRSGRLDAVRVAKRFGMTLTELSKALRRSVQAVHKTPDSPGLQQRLETLERVAFLAARLVSSEPTEFLKWLNTPSPDLDEEKPRKVLLEKPAVVLHWLEDAASGHPG